jgi:hypothetical protein
MGWDVLMVAFHMMRQNARTKVVPRDIANGIGTLFRLAVRSVSSRPERLAAALRRSRPTASCRAGLRTHQTRWDSSFMGGASNVTEADALLLRPPDRGIVADPTAGPRHRIAAQGEDHRKSLSTPPVGRSEIAVKLPVAVCRDEIRAKLAEAIAEIRGDYRAEIALKPLVH